MLQCYHATAKGDILLLLLSATIKDFLHSLFHTGPLLKHSIYPNQLDLFDNNPLFDSQQRHKRSAKTLS